jgi:hypothetical protein
MNLLPRDRAEQILADHAAGKRAGAIAKACGCSPATVRAYVNGLRTPGEPAPRADDFAPPPTAVSGWPMTRTCGRLPCSPSFPAWASATPGQRFTTRWSATASRRTRAPTATRQA